MLRVPSRSIGTVIGTVSGMALIVLCFASWDTIAYGFDTYYDSHAYDFVVTLKGFDAASNLANRVSGIAGVTGVETGLIAPVQVELADKSYTALGIVLEDDHTFTWFDTLEGTPAMSSGEGVWLGHNLSRVLDAQPGDTLTVTAQGLTQQVTVEGIFNQVLGSPMVIPMSLFRQWTPLHLANQAYVRVDPAGRAAAQNALNHLPGIIGVEDWQSTTQDIQRAIRFNGDNTAIFLVLGMILTFVVLFNSITSNLQDRSTELAIMQMQGFSKGEINRRITLETGIALLLGILLGIVPTLVLVDYSMQLYNTDVAGVLSVTNPVSWVYAVILLVIIALFSQWLSMRQVYKTNLGDVSKAVGV
jgi:putative ABC transport system permease protein